MLTQERYSVRQELTTKLWLKSTKDESFKQELFANPKEVIETELGQALPDHKKVKVLQEDDNTMYLVLPKNPQEGLTPPPITENVSEPIREAILATMSCSCDDPGTC
ncbi:MAG: NHLP leader peptide family natural product precursor [Symploca sp. SIO1B1]|nr:NHLP leader peptide family natural product precursor [Symploca sp. SIO1B1]